jgi:hypothetical protein
MTLQQLKNMLGRRPHGRAGVGGYTFPSDSTVLDSERIRRIELAVVAIEAALLDLGESVEGLDEEIGEINLAIKDLRASP